MKTIELFDEMPFVNEECGDTMWNEENLNPPKSSDNKSPLSEESIIKIQQNSSTATSK
ncbi:hypothetical protein [Dyadobacter diqingensis]|uniref:hypothetical protein n=1 Tax=Dyadobacter diqingensis TaxID=2938121 RepID=UPI0020C4F922|nr:hypothetical protein [Dyadobacter diqingensis]